MEDNGFEPMISAVTRQRPLLAGLIPHSLSLPDGDRTRNNLGESEVTYSNFVNREFDLLGFYIVVHKLMSFTIREHFF